MTPMTPMTPTLFYTVSRKELRPSEMPGTLPLLLSAASFLTQSKDGTYHLMPLRHPLPEGEKGADCGGFTVAVKWGATYRFEPAHYIAWLASWHPQWAATFDLPCVEPKRTTQGRLIFTYPGADVVQARQRFATRMAENFWIRGRHMPWTWCPSIQGFYPEEFEAHARQLAPLIRVMWACYSDPAWGETDEGTCPFRVGIGSLCGRARLPFLLEVIERVQAIIGDDIPLHLWGVKLKTLKKRIALPGVISLDTGGWNNLFGHEHERRRASGLTEIEYTWRISHPAYHRRVQKAQHQPQQLSLLSSDVEHPWQDVQYQHRKIADAVVNEEYNILDELMTTAQRKREADFHIKNKYKKPTA